MCIRDRIICITNLAWRTSLKEKRFFRVKASVIICGYRYDMLDTAVIQMCIRDRLYSACVLCYAEKILYLRRSYLCRIDMRTHPARNALSLIHIY